MTACSGAQNQPDRTLGKWQGTATQLEATGSTSHYPLALDVAADSASITYPSLGCSATLTRLPSPDERPEFRETLTKGNNRCFDGGMVTLDPQSDSKKMIWRWEQANAKGQPVVVAATLKRVTVKKHTAKKPVAKSAAKAEAVQKN